MSNVTHLILLSEAYAKIRRSEAKLAVDVTVMRHAGLYWLANLAAHDALVIETQHLRHTDQPAGAAITELLGLPLKVDHLDEDEKPRLSLTAPVR